MFDFLLILGGLFWFGAAIGTGYDAHKHGGSGIKWLLIVGILGIFGLLWYSQAHSSQRSPQESSHTLNVQGEVTDPETGSEKKVKLSVNTDSTSLAIDQFEASCREQGLQPVKKPEVVSVETTGSPETGRGASPGGSGDKVLYYVFAIGGGLFGYFLGYVASILLSYIFVSIGGFLVFIIPLVSFIIGWYISVYELGPRSVYGG